MNRRRFLGIVGTGFTVGAAGCLSDGGSPGTTPAGPTGTDPAPTVTVEGDSTRVGSLADPDLPLSDSDLRRGAAKDAIPAITDPVFGPDWSEESADLADDERVIGVTAGDAARAYPLAVLNWHEVVNDNFGGPLLVTFCPLCGSGVTAERRVDGQETVFGVSGLLWMSDLVMYDALTESLWSQVLGKAVKGPKTGTALALRPSTITTWGEWRGEHPETEVLLPPPKSATVKGEVSRDYDRDPYVGYDSSRRIGIGGDTADGRLHPKASVIGVATDEAARAYPLETVQDRGGVVNDTVGDLPVVVAATADGSLVAYERTVDGTTLTFARDGDVLTAGGSRWRIVSGRAQDGPHEGTTLTRANDRSPMFWFAWADFYPGTEIFGQG
ncbi:MULTISPECIES: DUF3179 domain-containing protein [Salinibaculum]|uniref:DUF3179 domain-containing protein n=1 Tax=Salinibaculum TaxID=2732368 RepID=UPI0030D13A12